MTSPTVPITIDPNFLGHPSRVISLERCRFLTGKIMPVDFEGGSTTMASAGDCAG